MQPNPFDPPRSFAQQGGAPQPGAPQPGAQHHPDGVGHSSDQPWPAPGTVPGQPVAAAPVETPRRRSWFARHKVLTSVGAVVLVGTIGGIAGGGGGDDAPADGAAPVAPAPETSASSPADPGATAPTAAAPEETQGTETLPGVGTPARDGKFEFTVTGVETGVATIGSDLVGTTAQGQFALVSVTVANIGDAAQSFFGDNATLVDDQGRSHSADSTAAIYLENSQSFITEINPGNAVEAVVVFDIPADAVPTSVELHDSMFSGGVTVSLQ